MADCQEFKPALFKEAKASNSLIANPVPSNKVREGNKPIDTSNLKYMVLNFLGKFYSHLSSFDKKRNKLVEKEGLSETPVDSISYDITMICMKGFDIYSFLHRDKKQQIS